MVNGKIYVFGGFGAGATANEEYDPSADSWSTRSPMPTARDHIAVPVVEGKIHVIGGRLGSFARNLAAHEGYDPSTDTWSEAAPLPRARSGIASAVMEGRIYVFRGEETGGTFDANEVYDSQTDEWIRRSHSTHGPPRTGGGGSGR